MPLDDREQRILEEIERQFYEEDPVLAHAVRNIDRPSRYGIRLPLAGLVLGVIIILVSFTSQRLVALAGFAVMVISATALANGIRARSGLVDEGQAPRADGQSWMRRFRRG